VIDVGGVLSNPADQYPSTFGKFQFFTDYPYALPTFGTGLFATSATVVAALFIEEVRSLHPET
jgi:hypothetical protein